jgi:hypothetical protein
MRHEGSPRGESILWRDAAHRDVQGMIREEDLRAASKRFQVERQAALMKAFAFAAEIGLQLVFLRA